MEQPPRNQPVTLHTQAPAAALMRPADPARVVLAERIMAHAQSRNISFRDAALEVGDSPITSHPSMKPATPESIRLYKRIQAHARQHGASFRVAAVALDAIDRAARTRPAPRGHAAVRRRVAAAHAGVDGDLRRRAELSVTSARKRIELNN